MSCRIEVTCFTKPGDQLFVAGSPSTLGAWDLEQALPLFTSAETYPVWVLDHPLIAAGSEFKFLIARMGKEQLEWEDLKQNRLWPAEELADGAVLRADYNTQGIFVASKGDGNAEVFEPAKDGSTMLTTKAVGRAYSDASTCLPSGLNKSRTSTEAWMTMQPTIADDVIEEDTAKPIANGGIKACFAGAMRCIRGDSGNSVQTPSDGMADQSLGA
mmetsp:Transcript_89194/g.251086  ORF Transcript_89194/g.251086 Transcript_89194/m.251086 type:complete len:215 (-) Transcript_89194:97-741(-)